jgi:uncharacterized membrane protein YqgA involved in biofilm formation
VVAGSLIGLAVGSGLPDDYRTLAQAAIGIGTLAMAIKMLLETKNILIPIGSLIFGVLLGHLIGIQAGVDALGAWAKEAFGSSSDTFQEAFVSTSILFCVGPLTLLGCLEDGLEGKIRLLALKSMLDGITSLFVAASLGVGVLLSAGTVLIVQGSLTLLAKRLRPLLEARHIIDEMSATGALILVTIGLKLIAVTDLPSADFLPALVFAGIAAKLFPPK